MVSEGGKRGRPFGGGASSSKSNNASASKAAKTSSSAISGAYVGSRGGGGGGAKSSAALRHISPIPLRESSEFNGDQGLELPLIRHGDPGALVLADGSVHQGFSFGANVPVAGEVVFNTGMVGYPEALTDPSYRGQILVLTYPMVGNYGVPAEDALDEHGLPLFFESSKIQVAGLIVASYSADHSHWNSAKSLGKWLQEHNVPALYGIDTRALTKKIRETGAILGKIDFKAEKATGKAGKGAQVALEFMDPNKTNLVAQVSTKAVKVYGKGKSPRIVAFDCGMKFNIIRYFVKYHDVQFTVVPFDYDLKANPAKLEWEGIFISNGPGDPTMCEATIETLKWAMNLEHPKPIFGICLGNQLLALAAGAKTFKMKYGNRGMNQPCVDMRTTKCYITAQNHGYAVDSDGLPHDWKTFFLNANDFSNEGIIHVSKPFFSVQFHPEACGGPTDTAFLFETFINLVRGSPHQLSLLDPCLYQRFKYKKVLLVGSGGLSIGQAGEFDYSGSQAIKALKEEGIEVILINPNVATVQTSKSLGKASPDKVYFLPIRPEVVLEIIKKEKPDGIMVNVGGQTALNVGIKLWESGDLQKHNVRVMGTPISTIIATEDREIFSEKLREIDETLALSFPATSMEEAKEAANKIGYPVLIRAAYALGGLGSGFAEDEAELVALAEKAFASSSQILIDQDLRGWKEIEYEVVRDIEDNCVTVCNMENFDPLGIHTGDSIVVAPSQTLSNQEYYMLRSTSIKVIRHLGIIGECNIQFALHPESEKYCIIEVNARLSRSSALASKATGYPLAYVATKLCLGKDLVSIRNSVTKTTTACFEPSLDYCVVKMPRWDLSKFNRVETRLGSSMISVGEVMAIGRNFEEAIQKAVRMVNPNLDGLDGKCAVSAALDNQIQIPTPHRLFAVQMALERGYSIDAVHALTKIDRWFLSKLKNISLMKAACSKGNLESLNAVSLRALKCHGFSDRQVARYVNSTEVVVRRRRLQMGIRPCVKQIDTLAAEFPAQTNYLYMTYNGSEDDLDPDVDGVMVLGCGPYCIGSSVEFDWCAVSAVRQIRATGMKAIVVNCNPETVSTDYDESDRLFFEELTFERVLDIYEREKAVGIIVSVGGQIANNLANPLFQQGVNILGTGPVDIDKAEDRHQFSELLDSIGVDQPSWQELSTIADAKIFADEVGYPVLVRPSFVLSGAAMNVAANARQLESFLQEAADVSQDKPVVVTKFILNAKEIEFDAVAKAGDILNYAISEHVENAGVHSGDATLVLPAQKLFVETIRKVKKISSAIAKALNITGPFNIQLMAKDNDVKVIECNLRASRTFPFVSKVFDANFITLATKAMLGVPTKAYNISLIDIDYVAVKAPMFSFTRLRGADPTLGVEMASTGEVACFGHDVHEAFLAALIASGFRMPIKTKNILVSIAEDSERLELLAAVTALLGMNYTVFCTPGTGEFYESRGLEVQILSKKPGDKKYPHVIDAIKMNKVDVVINVPEGTKKDEEVTIGYAMRRSAVDFGVPLVTNIKCANLLVEALARHKGIKVQSVESFYRIPTVGWQRETEMS